MKSIKPKWEDATSYSQGERGKKTATAWSMQTDRLSITITSGHIYYRGEWVIHCKEAGFDTYPMKIKVGDYSLEEVQRRAIEIVRAKLRLMLNSLPDPA